MGYEQMYDDYMLEQKKKKKLPASILEIPVNV